MLVVVALAGVSSLRRTSQRAEDGERREGKDSCPGHHLMEWDLSEGKGGPGLKPPVQMFTCFDGAGWKSISTFLCELSVLVQGFK